MPAPASPGPIEAQKRPARTLQQREEQLWDNIMLRYVAKARNWHVWERRLQASQDGSVVLKALCDLGLAALWSSRSDEVPDYVVAVQELVRERIRAWYVAARSNKHDERRRGAGMLKQLGSTLAGDNRGRRSKPAARPATVLYTYKRNLLRLRTAIDRLGSTRRGPASDSLVKEIADACSVPLERFRFWLGSYNNRDLDARGFVKGLRQDLKREARAWAASDHKITEPTVSNIVSKLTRSRK